MSRQKGRPKTKKSTSAKQHAPVSKNAPSRDIQSIKKALRESESRYQRLLDAVTAYAYAVQLDQGTPVDTRHGPGCLTVTGYRPGDFDKAPFLWLDIVHPDDRDAVLQHAQDILCGEVPPLEHRIVHRDGTTRWIRSTLIRHLEAGDLVRYDGILEDVTERRGLQDSLRASTDFLQTVLDAIPEVTVVVDAQHQIILANRAAEAWTDQQIPIVDSLTCGELFFPCQPEDCRDESENLLGNNEECLPRARTAGIDDGFRIGPKCPVAQVLATNQDVMVTRTLRNADGSQAIVEVSAAPITDSDGAVAAVVMSCRDISHRRRIEQALHDNEVQLLMAQKIQEHLLPDAAPSIEGFDISGVLCPAEFAAGDYYDYLSMRDGCLGLVIGDVTGHGFASALIMSLTQMLLRLLVEAHDEIPQVLRHANSVLSRATDEYHFVTLFLGRLDAQRRRFSYASAGHPPACVISRDGSVKSWLESTSHPLGMFPDIAFSTADTVTFEPGDTLVLVTDGIEEARTPEGEHFGRDRIVDVVHRHRRQSAQQIAKTLCRAAREFAGRSSPEDDTTVVVVRVLG